MAKIIDHTLFGSNLSGTDGADLIDGNFGNDTMSGLLGQDTLLGGVGNDVFVYVETGGLSEAVPGEVINGGDNTDTIRVDGNLFFVGAQITSIERVEFVSGGPAHGNRADFSALQIGQNRGLTIDGSNQTDEVHVIMGSESSLFLDFFGFKDWTPGSGDRVRVDGDSTAETILGSRQNDVISSGGGDDHLDGGQGVDALFAGSGNDTIDVEPFIFTGPGLPIDEAPGETIDGGSGFDSLNIIGPVDLFLSKITSIEQVIYRQNGSIGSDLFLASSQFGAGGIAKNLVLQSESGGEDTISITVDNKGSFSARDFQLTGWSQFEDIVKIFGDDGSQILEGTRLRDVVVGGEGNDSIFGGSFDGFESGDTLGGGGGSDTLFLSDLLRGATVDLANSTASFARISSFENIFGSAFDDTLAGSSDNNRLNGDDGNDTIVGGDGADTLLGGTGDDLLRGQDGDDTLSVVPDGAGTDTLDGGAGRNAWLFTNSGDHTHVDVVAGTIQEIAIDRLARGQFTIAASEFNEGISSSVVIDDNSVFSALVDNTIAFSMGEVSVINLSEVRFDSFNERDSIKLIGDDTAERMVGSARNDVFEAGAGADTINGGKGDDAIFGGAQVDRILGGEGQDDLSGGAGGDIFLYGATQESGVGSLFRDVITDFLGNDRINLAGIDANVTIADDQSFALDTDGDFSAGEIRQILEGNDLVLEFNTDGDIDAEMQIKLRGVTSVNDGDFVF